MKIYKKNEETYDKDDEESPEFIADDLADSDEKTLHATVVRRILAASKVKE